MCVVISTLLNGSVTGVPVTVHLNHLQAFVMGCVHVILMGVTRWDRKRNTKLYSIGGLEEVSVMVMRRGLQWLGHV